MKKIVFALFMFLLAARGEAQNFCSSVKIEFEKTVYARQLVKELEPEWYERIKDNVPQTTVSYFDFIGDTARSLYKPGKEVPVDPRSFTMSFADKNVVYNDYQTRTTVTQKPVFEETFLVQDSLTRIKWKLTTDTRTIAGFDCRKAIGLMDDSITVFAFYTDEILISSGPESANGLPGMILGLGMPRIHTTWFATKVEVNAANMKLVAPATKGKKVNRKTMMEAIGKALKDWGSYGKNMIWNFVI